MLYINKKMRLSRLLSYAYCLKREPVLIEISQIECKNSQNFFSCYLPLQLCNLKIFKVSLHSCIMYAFCELYPLYFT